MGSIFSFIIILLIFIWNCTPTVKVTRLTPTIYPPKAEIDVYSSVENVKRPYKEIALITVDDEGLGLSEDKMMSKLINKAKEIGADGVIILSPEKEEETFIGYYNYEGVSVPYFYFYGKKVIRGIAIVYEKEK